MTRLRQVGLAAVAALALVLTFAVAPATAQDMASGTWAGTVTGPDGQGVDVTFEVSAADGDLAIMLIPPADTGMGGMVLEEIAMADGVLTFVFPVPNVRVVCELSRDDEGAFEGECVGDDGNSGHMRMVPPA